MTAEVINLADYRRSEEIDAAICELIAIRTEMIIDEYRDVMQSDDPLYAFFMGKRL